jgi:cyclopropane fatty-acyl-phospholipid synthase-like methyltransferase
MKYVELLRKRPIAIETKTANQQHYEVGTGVLMGMLGPRMKYSCALYEGDGVKGSLDDAEIRMLECYVERAGLRDGMKVLDLGYVLFLSCDKLEGGLRQTHHVLHDLQNNIRTM